MLAVDPIGEHMLSQEGLILAVALVQVEENRTPSSKYFEELV